MVEHKIESSYTDRVVFVSALDNLGDSVLIKIESEGMGIIACRMTADDLLGLATFLQQVALDMTQGKEVD